MKKNLILATISGLLIALSLPKFYLPFLFLIGFYIFLKLIVENDIKKAFLYSTLVGFSFSIFSFYWINYSVVYYGDVSIFVAVPLFILFSIVFGIFQFGISGLTTKILIKRYKIETVFFLPFIWVILEILRENFPFGGFPWNLSGYMISYVNPFAQITSITSIYGLSFLVLFFSVSIFYFFHKKNVISSLIVFFSIFISVVLFLYGNYRIDNYQFSGKKVKVSIIQGNIPEDMKMSVEGKPEIVKKYITLIREAYYKDKPDLIVLPESALPFPPLSKGNKLKKEFFEGIEDVKVPIVIGFDNYFIRNGKLFLYNSMFLFTRGHNKKNYYNKIKLVPFGEYVPFPFKIFASLFPYLEGYDFIKGKQKKLLVYRDFRILPLICFEGIFPNFVASNSKRKPNLIVNITNDAWFKKTSAPYQHFEMVRVRAIETGNFLVRAANTGISAFVSPTGKIVKSLGLFEEGYLTAEIHLQDEETFFEKYRIQMFYFIFLVFLSFLFYFEWKYKN